MQFDDDRYHLHVEIDAKECTLPADERAHIQEALESLGVAVQDFPHSDLNLTVTRHPRSEEFNAEAKLKVPGQTLFTGDQDAYLDSVLQRCLQKLVRKVKGYKQNPDRGALETARRKTVLERDSVAPEAREGGLLGDAVRAGNYLAFRNHLIPYEDWLRVRVGRWIQRYPEAEARVGSKLLIGDLFEEVYLNAFENFDTRPTELSLSQWLDSLIDPALKETLRQPDEVRENASRALTLR